jgi:hypothetical protein
VEEEQRSKLNEEESRQSELDHKKLRSEKVKGGALNLEGKEQLNEEVL